MASTSFEDKTNKNPEYDQQGTAGRSFLADLENEKRRLGEEFPLCSILIDEAVERFNSTGHIPGKEFYADVYRQKPFRLCQKVFVPIKQYPKFNFTGKILGPKGNSLRRLQEETQCKITIKGRNSMRDHAKEEELRSSGDPRYAHLNKDLFVEISSAAPPAESYARVAYALAEIRKYLVPDKNDEVSHEQLRELMEIDPDSVKQYNKSIFDKKMGNGAGGPKFLNLIREVGYKTEMEGIEEPDEEEYEMYEEPPYQKRLVAPPYLKAKPSVSAPLHKRSPGPVYATEIKRIREAPVKSYKPSPHGILKKYK